MKIVQHNNYFELDNIKIMFFYKTRFGGEQYISGNDIEFESNEYNAKFLVKSSGTIGMMVYNFKGNLLADDCLNYVDPKISQQFVNTENHIVEGSIQIDRPIMNCISEKETYSFSSPNEVVITTFQYGFEPAFNIIGEYADTATFYIDKSTNYLVNLQRYPVDPKEKIFHKYCDIKEMGECLYKGYVLAEDIQNPQDKTLVANEILSITKCGVIVGSLAGFLNGMPIHANDVDIMFDNKEQMREAANNVCAQLGCTISEQTEFRIRIKYKDTLLEFGYDRFNLLKEPKHIRIYKDLKYLDMEGILQMCLITHYRLYRSSHVDQYHNKVSAQIFRYMTYMNPYFIYEDETIMPNVFPEKYFGFFKELLGKINKSKLEYLDVRVNSPFRIKCFSEDNLWHMPIANLGSPNDARIICPPIKSAKWRDITGRVEEVEYQDHDNFSIIFVDKIDFPGILTCIKK